MTDIAITVQSLGKAYRIGLKEEIPDTFVGAVSSWVRAPLRNLRRLKRLDTFDVDDEADDTFWALKDVSFEVRRGEVVGIVGHNGAGKSTLLKILSRITEPTTGRVVIHGRVSSLLEVGTGFHPELSGRENIYMNGTILGMKKREIDRKFDAIVAFSGIEKFLDTPAKRYSSGMTVRLAFSVAAHLDPEILIIDEVLAVGDAEFQKKCLGKMEDVANSGRTVLFVSHNMAAVESLCTRGIGLDRGRAILVGPVHSVISEYRRRVFASAAHDPASDAFAAAQIVKRAWLVNDKGESTSFLPIGTTFRLRLELSLPTQVRNPVIGVGVDAVFGQRVLTLHTPVSSGLGQLQAGTTIVECCVPVFPLAPGEYRLKLALADSQQQLDVLNSVLPFVVADGDAFGEGRGFHRGMCVAPSDWRILDTSNKATDNVI